MILVTGATETVGSEVVRQLLATFAIEHADAFEGAARAP